MDQFVGVYLEMDRIMNFKSSCAMTMREATNNTIRTSKKVGLTMMPSPSNQTESSC